MIRWLRCLRRGHIPEFVRNVYGDEINQLNARSIWRCTHCRRVLYLPNLHNPENLMNNRQPWPPAPPLDPSLRQAAERELLDQKAREAATPAPPPKPADEQAKG